MKCLYVEDTMKRLEAFEDVAGRLGYEVTETDVHTAYYCYEDTGRDILRVLRKYADDLALFSVAEEMLRAITGCDVDELIDRMEDHAEDYDSL